MNKKLLIFLGIIVILALIGIIIYTQFEIYPKTATTPPLREVQGNYFAALERWLRDSGYNFRTIKRASANQIASSPEKTVLAYANFCSWKNAGEILLPWMENGGNLIICIDQQYDESTPLAVFLSQMGIIISDPDTTEEQMEAENTGFPEDIDSLREIPFPDFDLTICFLLADNAPRDRIALIKEFWGHWGYIRLVQIKTGSGTLTVMGKPVFMYNSQINSRSNAALTWSLTGAKIDNGSGLLLIRDRYLPQRLFGKIAERGNFLPLIISVFLLIIIGFWMLIPVYGPVFSEKKSSARPLRQRFLAEIRFLKKYNALETYLHVYLSWLKPKLSGSSDESEINYIEQIIQNYQTNGQEKKSIKYRDIIKALGKIQIFTERL